MDRLPPSDIAAHEGNGDPHRTSKRAILAGVDVREDDIETQPGLHLATIVIRTCAIIVLLLAIWQFIDWWTHRPPGGAGVGVLAGETVRLIVLSGLLWAASSLADLAVKTHHDLRASRILLARQTYMMRQMGLADGAFVAQSDPTAATNRRGLELAAPSRPSKGARPDA